MDRRLLLNFGTYNTFFNINLVLLMYPIYVQTNAAITLSPWANKIVSSHLFLFINVSMLLVIGHLALESIVHLVMLFGSFFLLSPLDT